MVVDHAKLGMELLSQYKRIYSYFYLSPLQLFYLVSLSDAVVRYDGNGETTPRTVELCLTSLQEAKVGYPVAGSLQQMFRHSLSEYQIPVSDALERMIGASAHLGPEELLNACTRPTYKQPISQLMPALDADLGYAFLSRWQHLAESRSPELPLSESSGSGGNGKGKRVKIASLLNM